MTGPDVSVIMPAYQHAAFIDEAISSIRCQTLENLELVVVDDGSADGSLAIAQRHAVADHRVRVIRTEHGGPSAARNRGIDVSRAPWIAFLDDDDVALPSRLERQLDFLRANTGVDATGTFGWRIGSRGLESGVVEMGPTTTGEFRALRDNNEIVYLLTSSVMVSRHILVALGGFRTISGAGEDVDMWCRIADDHEIRVMPEYLVRYRVHSHSLSSQRFFTQARTTLLVKENMRRRRIHLTEIGPLEFQTVLEAAPWLSGARRRIGWQARLWYRRGGALLADRDIRGLGWLTASFVLSPLDTIERLATQLLPWLRLRSRRHTRSLGG